MWNLKEKILTSRSFSVDKYVQTGNKQKKTGSLKHHFSQNSLHYCNCCNSVRVWQEIQDVFPLRSLESSSLLAEFFWLCSPLLTLLREKVSPENGSEKIPDGGPLIHFFKMFFNFWNCYLWPWQGIDFISWYDWGQFCLSSQLLYTVWCLLKTPTGSWEDILASFLWIYGFKHCVGITYSFCLNCTWGTKRLVITKSMDL